MLNDVDDADDGDGVDGKRLRSLLTNFDEIVLVSILSDVGGLM